MIRTLGFTIALVVLCGCQATMRAGKLTGSCSTELTYNNNGKKNVLLLKVDGGTRQHYVVTLPLPAPSINSFAVIHCTDPTVVLLVGWGFYSGAYPIGETKWVKANAEGTDFILQIDDTAQKHRVIMRSFGIDDSTEKDRYHDIVHVQSLRGTGAKGDLRKKDQYYEVDIRGTLMGPFQVSTRADDPLRIFVDSCGP